MNKQELVEAVVDAARENGEVISMRAAKERTLTSKDSIKNFGLGK